MSVHIVHPDHEHMLNYAHLLSLTDDKGVFEHCEFSQPRIEHGYCVDDVSRALIVVAREPYQDPVLARAAAVYFNFLSNAQTSDGRVVNRCDVFGNWNGPADTSDHWGRAIWAWGTVVSRSKDPAMAAAAYEKFLVSANKRGAFLRSMLFASLGAIEVLKVVPDNRTARSLIADTVDLIATSQNSKWPWPEERLTYSNAAIPEVLMQAGNYLHAPALARRGLSLLHWLVENQTIHTRLSITPSHGFGYMQTRPGFDQQPIEVAALADACAAAFDISSDELWRNVINMSARWFEGVNDMGVQMYEPRTGAGFDGLTANGRNENQGAESTLAYLSTMQQWNRYCGRG